MKNLKKGDMIYRPLMVLLYHYGIVYDENKIFHITNKYILKKNSD